MKLNGTLSILSALTSFALWVAATPLSNGPRKTSALNRVSLSLEEYPPSPLDRRIVDYLGDGWWLHYDTWSSLLPWQEAAEGIEGFFSTIVESANGVWLNEAPRHYLQVFKGDLNFELFSESQPVSWQFVASLADTIRQALENGMSGMFDMRIISSTGVVVYVHLRVKQAFRAGAQVAAAAAAA